MGDVAGQRRERRLLGRLPGQRQRTHRPAVETILRGNQFRAAGETGEFERHLVGLGAGVAEEHPRLRIAAEQADQRLGQRDAGFGGIQVGGVSQRRHLSRDGVEHGGVRDVPAR